MKNLFPPSIRYSELLQITKDEVEKAIEKMDYSKAEVILGFFYKIAQNLVLPEDEEELADEHDIIMSKIVNHHDAHLANDE